MTLFCHSKSRVISLQSWYLTSLVTSHFYKVWRDFHMTKFELLRYIHFVCRTIYINGRWFGKPSSLWRSSLGRILFCIYRIAQHPYLFKTEWYLKKFCFFGARLRNHIFSADQMLTSVSGCGMINMLGGLWAALLISAPPGPGRQKKWPLTVCSF